MAGRVKGRDYIILGKFGDSVYRQFVSKWWRGNSRGGEVLARKRGTAFLGQIMVDTQCYHSF